MNTRGNHGSAREKHIQNSRFGKRGRGGGFKGTNWPNKNQGVPNQKSWTYGPNWDRRSWSRKPKDNFVYKKSNNWPDNNTHRFNFEQTINNDYFQFQLGESSKEPDEEGPPLPGSEAERSNKIESDKKRIQEVLSSASELNQTLNFKNCNTESGSKENLSTAKKLISLSELRLTANDLMEIGSVAGKSIENNNIEDNDEVSPLNVSYIPLQFNNNASENDQQRYNSGNKSQSGGWKSFQIPSDFSEINVSETENCQISTSSQNQFRSQREERILGDVITSKEPRFVEPTVVSNVSDRIGRLYKSFLKARYFGCKLKLSSEELHKQKVQNPLLDNSVAESQSAPDKNGNQEKTVKKTVVDNEEPVMPLPIQIKMEMVESNVDKEGSGSKEELEADEFLKEFSHLLTPDLTIPYSTLEQLGLSYLTDYPLPEVEPNKSSAHGSSKPVEQKSDRLLRVKSLSTLNSTPFVDNLSSPRQRNEPVTPTMNETNSPSTLRHRLSPVNVSPGLFANQSLHVIGENKTLNRSVDNLSETNGLNVQHVVNEVVEKILSTTKTGKQSNVNERSLNQVNESVPFAELDNIVKKLKESVNSVIDNKKSSGKQQNFKENENVTVLSDYSVRSQASLSNVLSHESNVSRTADQDKECLQNCQSKSQLIDVSDKMLKMFLIDKQIQQLMEEKIKLYNELMSTKEIASTFFTSWAKDKQGSGTIHRTDVSSTCTVPQQTNNGNQVHSNLNSFIRPSTSADPSTLNNILHDVEAVKQCLISFRTNTVSDVVSTCKESLIEVKKEAMSRHENADESDGTSFSSQNIHSDSENDKNKKKRKKKVPPVNSNNPGKKKKNSDADKLNLSSNNSTVENSSAVKMQNLNAFDEIIEINSDDERFEDLRETKFDPSNIKEHVKERNTNELKMKENETQKDLEFSHEGETILCMKISELQKVCVTGCKDGKLLIYSLTSGKLKGRLKGHQESITCLCEYKGLIISGSTDLTIRCFHIKTRTELYNVSVGHQVQCMDLKFGFLFVGTKVGFLYTYSVKEKLNLVDDPLNLTNSSILAVRAAKEGVRNILIVAARGEQITIRDATTGLLIRTFNWCDTVYCLEFAGESPVVYCGTRTKSVIAVDFINGEEKFKCDAGLGVSQICFAHDLMFTACYDGKVYIYDYKKKDLVTRVVVSKGMLLSLMVYKNQIIVATTRSELLVVPFPQELKKYLNLEEKT